MKLVYVLGRGRSGSTIFANVLGEHEGFFSAGEVRYLWDPVIINDGGCACGDKVSNCVVWSKVLELVRDISSEEAAECQREVVAERNLLRLLRYPRGGGWPALERFVVIMQRVYDSLRQVTGASVIVDSSKRPSYAAVVRLLDGCDPYWVQMVRDPRASAYSWATRRHASVFGEGKEVTRRSAFDSTVRWNVLNLEAELLRRRLPEDRTLRLRYEEFAAAPRETVGRVTQFVGEGHVTSPFLDPRTVSLKPNHTIAGNPSRLASGELVIEDRAEWRRKQRSLDRYIATTVSLPYLHRYGYRLNVSGDRS